MKYFTKNWHKGTFSKSKTEAVIQSYWEHISILNPSLSEQIFKLANETNLHDSSIQRVIFNPKASVLILELICGDLQNGYFELELKYMDARLTLSNLNILRTVSVEKKSEVLYDEIDISKKGYIHRFLFWPYCEVDINFADLSLVKRPSATRNIQKYLDRFVEIKNPDNKA